MKAMALGVVQDLRERRLLPVAILLVAALIGVPALMLKPAEPAPEPVAASPITPPAGAEAGVAPSVAGPCGVAPAVVPWALGDR